MQDHRGAESFGEAVHLVDQRGIVDLRLGRHRGSRFIVQGSALDAELLQMAPPPGTVDPRPCRHPAGDAEEPAAHRIPVPDGPGLAHQDQEGRLKGIVGVVRVAQFAPADAQHHRAVTVDQRREGGLRGRGIIPGQKSFQELTIGQGAGRAQAVERAELTDRRAARSCTRHRGSPL